MPETSANSPTLPPDDLRRELALAKPNEDSELPRIGVVGDTYTILLSGKDTGGRYCLIDMHVPAGGGPPRHRHDFEESFTIREGEIEITFRGQKSILRAGETANIPPNAPHQFANKTDRSVPPSVHMLAGRTGRVLPGRGYGRREPNDASSQTRRRQGGGIQGKSRTR